MLRPRLNANQLLAKLLQKNLLFLNGTMKKVSEGNGLKSINVVRNRQLFKHLSSI